VTLLAFKACGASGNRRPVGSTPTHFRHPRHNCIFGRSLHIHFDVGPTGQATVGTAFGFDNCIFGRSPHIHAEVFEAFNALIALASSS